MAMMYPHGVENILDPKSLMHAARIGAELGADIVKTYYTGDPDTFKMVTESCPVPIVMSGGPKADEPIDFLKIGSRRDGWRRNGSGCGKKCLAEPSP